jgi:hypothetical protein
MKPEELDALQEQGMMEHYWGKYKKHIEIFEKSLVSKAIRIQDHHRIQLGKMLDQWKVYERLSEANGSLNTLGELPKVALDVITATMSNSVLPVIATTQTINSQKSIIWFKNIIAKDTKGNITDGDVLVNPRTGTKTPSGYASGQVIGEAGVDPTIAAQTAYTFNVNNSESIRRQFVRVYLESDPTIEAFDFEGKGLLFGRGGIEGSINYETGEISVNLAADPGGADKILVDYFQNYEEMADVPKIDHFLDSTDVNAKPYALKAVMGLFEMFELRQRIGDSALQDVATDLTRSINNEIGGDFIRQYDSIAGGSTQFSLTIPSAVAEYEHRRSYAFRMADAEADLISRAGRGTIKVMIVGREHAALVRGLDGFQLLSDSNSLGAHVFGTYRGVTYVRVPEEALLNAGKGIGLYTGSSPLESAGVYAPYMPLTIQDSPLSPNPLTQQKVAATMAATKVVVPQYAVRFDVVA